MMKAKWAAAAALLSMSAGAFAAGTYEFDSVTNLTHNGSSVTGVLVNDTVPTVVALGYATTGTCFEWLQLMMKMPGKFTLTIVVTASGFPAYDSVTSCNLTAKP